ncbi:GntR family transcriptional regulator [Bradyrhizobium sp. NP1]|uniref:GntR family transcriptional regulator n=1 Tax=Bradyrhizobium sp. NP1 TaxID=3049772 RepID=UPI0025A63E60|nr:GntR family transcriptional regulator [Bradyrhizobium sp. NP1]WJR77273.1 GntR family transcriptional regulator [Bradyrhizobium sp. NP1]
MKRDNADGTDGKRQPLYRQIAEALESRITAGKYPIGSKLPTEHQLVAKHRISRATAIAALDYLEAQGFVYRRPRLGTEVVSRYPIKQQVTEGDVFHDWARMGTEYKLEIVDREIVKIPPQLREGRTQMGGNWLHLIGVRRAGRSEKPICVAEIYVHPDYAGISDDIDRFPPRVFAMIEEKFNLAIRTVQQELRAVIVTPERADLLQISRKSPALEIVRWYCGPNSKPIEVTVDTHPGDIFTYKSEVHRGQFR